MPILDGCCPSQKSIRRCLSLCAWIVTPTHCLKTRIWFGSSPKCRMALRLRAPARIEESTAGEVTHQHWYASGPIPSWLSGTPEMTLVVIHWSRCDWGIGRGCSWWWVGERLNFKNVMSSGLWRAVKYTDPCTSRSCVLHGQAISIITTSLTRRYIAKPGQGR